MSDEISDEEKRTLWVGGIDSRVDEELLYELMLNVSKMNINVIDTSGPPHLSGYYYVGSYRCI